MTNRVVYTSVPTNKWVHCDGCAVSRWQGLSISLKSPGLLNTMQVNGACLFIVELSSGHNMTIAGLWSPIEDPPTPRSPPLQVTGPQSRKGEESLFCFTELQANTVGARVHRSGRLQAQGLHWAPHHHQYTRWLTDLDLCAESVLFGLSVSLHFPWESRALTLGENQKYCSNFG